MKKYIILFLFPAFFVLSSCTKSERKIEDFKDFTSTIEDEKEILSETKAKDTKSENIKKPVENEIKTENSEKEIVKEEKKSISQPIWLREYSDKYHLGYLSFDVANFYSELQRKNTGDVSDEYEMKFYSKTNGFVDYLFGWMSYTISNFKYNGQKIIPNKFKTKVKLKEKVREIEISYDENGNVIAESVNPPDNRDKRPAVADSLKKGVYDPLTVGIEARRMIIKCFKEDSFSKAGFYKFSLPLYDARRRTDILFELFKKKEEGMYKVRMRWKKIAGYTENELKDENKSEKAYIDIFFKDDKYVPLKIEGSSPVGTAKALYSSQCLGGLSKCINTK